MFAFEGYICIVCSLNSESKKQCDDIIKFFSTKTYTDVDITIYHPFEDQTGSVYHRQKEYLKKIDEADLIIAIPILSYTDESESFKETTAIISQFDKTVSYEIAYARHIGKPVVIWGEDSFWRNLEEEGKKYDNPER